MDRYRYWLQLLASAGASALLAPSLALSTRDTQALRSSVHDSLAFSPPSMLVSLLNVIASTASPTHTVRCSTSTPRSVRRCLSVGEI